jgi:hypothetical protein
MVIGEAGNHRIRKVTPGGIVSTLAGSGSAAFANGAGTSSSFWSPCGVALDADGNVVVGDSENHRIRKVTPGGIVSTLAGSGTGAFADGTGVGASFSNPYGVAVDASGNIIVADWLNQRIRKVTPGGVVTTLAGSGTRASTNGIGRGASFMDPKGVAVDTSGNVIVGGLSQLRKVTPGGMVSTLAGSGSGFADGTGADALIGGIIGVAVDAGGNVIAADSFNHRIRKLTVAPCAPGFFCPDPLTSTLCPPGYFCLGGPSSPSPCPLGTFPPPACLPARPAAAPHTPPPMAPCPARPSARPARTGPPMAAPPPLKRAPPARPVSSQTTRAPPPATPAPLALSAPSPVQAAQPPASPARPGL